ncbi:MAG: sporulation protein YunB, partial [Oscillospiraceae bacterium]
EINKIKSMLTYEVTNEINTIYEKKFYISIGTLLGNNIFSGKGKKIGFSIEPTGFLESDIKSEFSQAGINQTKHNIVLNLKLNVTTIVPFKSACTTVSTNMIIAETVIVGEVPQYYTNVEGANEKTIADINDYSYK